MVQDRRIITFTCDRSGVGQSMALSSAALVLAANGRRVLAIDWDLAKPSLAKYFTPLLPTDALANNDGVIDLVWSYASAVRRLPPSDVPELQLNRAAVVPSECAVPDVLRVRSLGAIHLFSAGREPRRSLRVRYFSWGEFFDRLDGEGLLTKFLGELKGRYDHILIDCPRLSHASRFPILNADILVPCFTLDRESVEAAAAIARWVSERLIGRRLFVCPLPMRVDYAELQLLNQARQYTQRVFQELGELAILPTGAQLSTGLEIPETPFYAYQRILPPLVDRGRAVAAYRQLACALAGQPDIEWNGPAEQQAMQYRSTYDAATDRFLAGEVLPFPSPYSGDELYAFVSYARDDRDEVMPVLQELLDLGWRLWWDEEIPGGSEWRAYLHGRIEKASHVLVFLSARSVRSKWVAEEIRLAHGLRKPFLSIRLDRSAVADEAQAVLGRYQMLDRTVSDFAEQLGRAMQLLRASSDAT